MFSTTVQLHSSCVATPSSQYHHGTTAIFNMPSRNGKGNSKSPSVTDRIRQNLGRRGSNREEPSSSSSSSIFRRASSRLGPSSGPSSSHNSKEMEVPAAADSNNSFGPPPPYQEISPSHHRSGASNRLTLANASTRDDPYAFLRMVDTVFLIDDSYSMKYRNWEETETALNYILPICVQRDQDGVDLYFLNHQTEDQEHLPSGVAQSGYYNVSSVEYIKQIFSTVQPDGWTPTADRLKCILRKYMDNYEKKLSEARQVNPSAMECGIKPLNLIMITDGMASDNPEEALVETARRLDRVDAPLSQVGVQFFQVGDDKKATDMLKDLDDNLPRYGIRDIVDTSKFNQSSKGRRQVLEGENILKVVLGSIIKRLDRQSTLTA